MGICPGQGPPHKIVIDFLCMFFVVESLESITISICARMLRKEDMQFFMKLFLTDEMFRKITKWIKTHMWKYFEDNNDDQGLQTSRNFTKVNDMKNFWAGFF